MGSSHSYRGGRHAYGGDRPPDAVRVPSGGRHRNQTTAGHPPRVWPSAMVDGIGGGLLKNEGRSEGGGRIFKNKKNKQNGDGEQEGRIVFSLKNREREMNDDGE